MRFQKTQTQSKEKGIKKSPTREINKTQKVAQHIAQQQVMELSSDELEKIVLKDSDDILDIDDDINVEENDADLVDLDDDEPEGESDTQFEFYDYQYSSFPGEIVEFEESPIVNFSYIIRIHKNALSNNFECLLELPSWFNFDNLKFNYKESFEKVERFLNKLCTWFNVHQKFLSNPSPMTFTNCQSNFSNEPIVTQGGFIEEINKNIKKEKKMTKTNFSRLVNKIGLVWDEKCMPLRKLFTKEFSLEWAVSAVLQNRELKNWNVNDSKTTKKKIEQIKNMSFSTMDNFERLIFISTKVTQVKANEINSVINSRKDSKNDS